MWPGEFATDELWLHSVYNLSPGRHSAAASTESAPLLPWSMLDVAEVPGTDGRLRLMQRGAEFSIVLGNIELMNSRLSRSEEALATVACAKIRDRRCSRVLIGGLGMGFTLRAALNQLEADSEIIVAELVPAVLQWAKGSLADIFGGCLADPRVNILEGDVGPLIRSRTSAYDAILLDVDNGPNGLTRQANDGLYDVAGISAAKEALRPAEYWPSGQRGLTGVSSTGFAGAVSTWKSCASALTGPAGVLGMLFGSRRPERRLSQPVPHLTQRNEAAFKVTCQDHRRGWKPSPR